MLYYAPSLALSNFSKIFDIQCDASGTGIGVILIQENQPIDYFSQKLNGAALNNTIYDKELHALLNFGDLATLFVVQKVHYSHQPCILEKFERTKKIESTSCQVDGVHWGFPYVIKYALVSILNAKLIGFEYIKELYEYDDYYASILRPCEKTAY